MVRFLLIFLTFIVSHDTGVDFPIPSETERIHVQKSSKSFIIGMLSGFDLSLLHNPGLPSKGTHVQLSGMSIRPLFGSPAVVRGRTTVVCSVVSGERVRALPNLEERVLSFAIVHMTPQHMLGMRSSGRIER